MHIGWTYSQKIASKTTKFVKNNKNIHNKLTILKFVLIWSKIKILPATYYTVQYNNNTVNEIFVNKFKKWFNFFPNAHVH